MTGSPCVSSGIQCLRGISVLCLYLNNTKGNNNQHVSKKFQVLYYESKIWRTLDTLMSGIYSSETNDGETMKHY